MSEKVLKVLSNVSQGLTETQKAQARSNIGCAGSYTAGTGITINDHSIINTAPNVKSDWNAATGTSAEILNKPSIGNGTLTIQKNGTSVATFSANQSGNATANIAVPTDTSDLTNGAGFVTASQIPSQVNADWNASSGVAEILNKPSVPNIKTTTTSLPPVETAVSSMTLFDDGRVRVNNSTDVGLLAPTGSQADSGKVLVGNYVGSPGKFTAQWATLPTPTGGIPEITPMGTQAYYASGNDYINMEDNVAYFIETNSGGSFTIHLGTLSRQTIHSKIYLVGTQANCVTMTVVYEDEAGQVCELNFGYGDSQSDTYYGLDVYARLVTVGEGGSLSFDTTMCRVYDYPCQNRDYFSSDNNNIGLVVDYVEPL